MMVFFLVLFCGHIQMVFKFVYVLVEVCLFGPQLSSLEQMVKVSVRSVDDTDKTIIDWYMERNVMEIY